MKVSALKVIAFSLPGSEASARTRLLDLQPALAQAGVELELRTWPRRGAARRRVGRSLGEHDVVLLQRVLVEERVLVGLRRAARALVLDMDDAIDQRPWGRRASFRLRRRYLRTLAACNLVTAGSEHLRQRAARLHPRVRLLPPATAAPAQLAARPAPPLRLVWTGSRHTLPYLEDLGPLLAEVAREGPYQLRVLADRAPLLPEGVPVEFVPWTLEAEEEALRWAHVGLYPLRDDPWSAGKCAYKVRRYMAFGLATLASPQGGGEEALEPPTAGWIAATPEEWGAELRRLLAEPERIAEMGQRARALSLARDTLELRGARFARILSEAAAVGRRRTTRG